VSDFLSAMSDASLLRARAARAGAGTNGLRERAASAPPPRAIGLSQAGFDVIAEAKLASPAEGRLTEGGADRVVELAVVFADRGAAVVSVLTEETRFAGRLEHLEAAAAAVDLPVMRKDFLVDPIQLLEARAAGASGVLLIARLLPEALLAEMTEQAMAMGMFVLVEVFDRSDLETAVGVFDREVYVGVNCRDLVSLEVDRGRFESLAPHLPDHLPAVAESGIAEPGHAGEVARLGYRLALVGSSLVSARDPSAALDSILHAGRTARTEAER